jgi:hypothetical protein
MDIGGSAMKGVILADGQAVPTPAATKLRELLTESPSKRVDLFHVLDSNPPPPAFQGAFANGFDAIHEEKENSPPEESPSLSSGSSSPTQERTPQPKPKRRSSARVKTERTLPTWNQSTEDLAPSPAATLAPPQPRGMQRAVSAPALWNPEDDDDLPSPFIKRVDRNAPKVSSAPKGLSLEKRSSKPVLKQDPNGTTKAAPKATAIKPSTSRPSVGKPMVRAVSSRP